MTDADLVLTNGIVYAVDPGRTVHEAVAIHNGRISAVGRAQDVLSLAGPRADVIDLEGLLVLPGFIDAHMHPMGAASDLFEPSLRGCRSAAECLERVRRFVADHPATPYVTAWGWSAALIDEVELTAARLDADVSDRPVALYDDGGHSMWVNSPALALAGIAADTPDPPGGVIERGAGGAPSGLLREAPIMWVERALPERSIDEWTEALTHFQKDVAGPLGLTTVQEAVVRPGSSLLDAYERMQARGLLTLRFCVSLWMEEDRPLDEQIDRLVAERARHRGPLVQARCAKLFADGVVEGHTAYLKHDYTDRPGCRGAPVWRPERFVAASSAAAKAGFQLHFHAIGDAAVALCLDAVEAAGRGRGEIPARSLITHLQLVDPVDVRRFADLDVVALPQPYWFAKDAMYAEVQVPSLGLPRADHEYPMRCFWDRGVVVASGSDYPVTPPPDPLLGIQRGVTRSAAGGDDAQDALWPDERVTVDQMIRSFTINGAYANFLEAETGSIEVGKSADLIVLSDDILESPPERVGEAQVLLTLFRGAAVHARAPFESLVSAGQNAASAAPNTPKE